MRVNIISSIILLSITVHCVFAQSAYDSISHIIATTQNDSLKIEALLGISYEAESPDQMIEYAQRALELSKSKGYPILTSQITTALGIFYYELGNYEKTLDFFYQSQQINESLNDTVSLARSYNNIGLVLSDLGRIKETIKYHKLSLGIKRSLNDERGVANSYSNLGLAYEMLDSLDLAMSFYKKALLIDLQLNNTYGLYTTYSNMGKNHYRRANYDSCAFYYNKAVMLSDQINNQYNKAELLHDYADLNAARNETERAIEKYNSSLMLAEEVEAQTIIRDNYLGLSHVFESNGNLKKAFTFYQKYDSVNKLIFNEEQTQKLAEVESNYRIQKGQKEIELLKKEAEIKDLRIRNNTYLLYFLLAVLLLIAAIVILQYKKNLYKNRTNNLLKTQNDEIVEKNKNIMDSIFYAKNIQKAILPSGQNLKEIFHDAFVFSKARDVVNGDFYWFTEKVDKIIIAAVDCTGHGVPAAFLNVLGNSHLNNIVIEQNVLEPEKILLQLNERMQSSMHSNKVDLHTDNGMDIGLCLFDKATGKLSFAGAKRPLYYFSKKELRIIKGDSHPVGGEAYRIDRHFKQHEVQLQKGDCFYLFTDGIVDQFGGKKDRKFMYPQLRSLLRRIFEQPMEDQLMVIKDDLNTWKGNKEQTDDILIMGLRV